MKDMQLDPTKEEVNEIFSALDQNGDGAIELKEFITGMRWLKKLNDRNETTSSSAIPEEAKSENEKLKQANELLFNVGIYHFSIMSLTSQFST